MMCRSSLLSNYLIDIALHLTTAIIDGIIMGILNQKVLIRIRPWVHAARILACVCIFGNITTKLKLLHLLWLLSRLAHEQDRFLHPIS